MTQQPPPPPPPQHLPMAPQQHLHMAPHQHLPMAPHHNLPMAPHHNLPTAPHHNVVWPPPNFQPPPPPPPPIPFATRPPPTQPAAHSQWPLGQPPQLQPFSEQDAADGTIDVYQSITSTNQHSDVNFEELRRGDWKDHYPANKASDSAFAPLPTGLVRARLPTNILKCPSHWVRTATDDTMALSSPMVTVRVGAENETHDFHVHELIITRKSEFMRTALQKEWKEGQERIVNLPEDSMFVYALYQQWLYTEQIPSSKRRPEEEYEQLVQAYCLGEKLIDTEFKDAVIDCIVDKLLSTRIFDLRLSKYVYENTLPGSPLRLLWTHIYVWSGNSSWVDKDEMKDVLNEEVTRDLAELQMSFWGGVRPNDAPYLRGEICAYHDHAEDDSCYDEDD